MIPKIIHYCWFGGNEKSKTVKKCIDSWKIYCPDYKIIEWNEGNFDINSNNYVKQAYDSKKYAFVSDYVRLYALDLYGGIYMDTDVEVFKSFDDILDNTGVFGFEQKEYVATSFMAAVPKNPLIKEFFDLYENEVFKNSDGSLNTKTNVERLTSLFVSKGMVKKNELQEFEGNVIYPKEYFSPYDYINCVNEKTQNTYCIHWFEVSWMSGKTKLIRTVKKYTSLIFGKSFLNAVRRLIKK